MRTLLKVNNNNRINNYLINNTEIETPSLLIDLNTVKDKFSELKNSFDFCKCYFSIKANSNPLIISTLLENGCHFETASIQEIKLCIDNDVPPSSIHFGNSIKKSDDIKQAFELGIRSFAFDSIDEIKKIAKQAPGSKIIGRIKSDGEGSLWKLTEKFGLSTDEIIPLFIEAKNLNLIPLGISFHVGSQQYESEAWQRALLECKKIISTLKSYNINLGVINLGGGLPSYSCSHIKSRSLPNHISLYGQEIKKFIQQSMPDGIDYWIEPGRFLVADAGVIKTKIIAIAERKFKNELVTWIYTDVGKFNGFYEAGEAFFFHSVISNGQFSSCEEKIAAVVAGPSCDSADILFGLEDRLILPKSIQVNDYLVFYGTGAYSTSYATCHFNGFPPILENFIQ
jgi:ornithine decarboxylase